MGELVPAIAAFLGLGVLALIVWHCLGSELAFWRTLSHRQPLDDATFFDRYYAPTAVPPEIPLRLRPIYARFFGIDPAKLRPEDRPPAVEDVDMLELILHIEQAFNVTIPSDDAENIDGSFDSIVQYLAAKKMQPHDR